ncbi:MAG: hypothetical protein GWP09_02400 [Nitrospiraceae bacterium]|nr:hypothetical protein [Nitrospiraceae bacterium]
MSNWQKKVAELFPDIVANVKDFGAIGDGIADDTAAIQKAIDIGKRIYIPKGVYIISSNLTVNNDNVIIEGEGWNTIIKVNNDNVTEAFNLSGDSIIIRNLVVNGNKGILTDNNTHCGIRIYSNECKVENVYVYDCERTGILVNYETVRPQKNIISECLVSNCDLGIAVFGSNNIVRDNEIKDCSEFGIEAGYPNNDDNGNIIKGNKSYNNGYYGISMNGNYGEIIGNICYNNLESGIYTRGDTNPTSLQKGINVVGNECFLNGIDGIDVNGPNHSTVVGNTCYNNNQASNTDAWLQTGIALRGGKFTATGNVCYDDQDTKTQMFGIYLYYGDYSTVIGNDCEGNGDATNDIAQSSSSNSKIAWNQGRYTTLGSA